MTTILLLILIVVMVTGFAAVAWALSRAKSNPDQALNTLFEKNEEQRRRDKSETDSSIQNMLTGNQKQIDLIVRQLQDQLRDSQGDIKSLKEQNAALKEHMTQSLQITRDLQVSTEGLRNLLSNNRLRGDWGEQVAEDLLLAAGFVENVNFVKQSANDSTAGRPDFTILLPDGTKLNIDAKFPFDDLVAYQEATDDADKKRALKNFENAVKDKVRQITTRDYINPEDQTVDFVVMFIPNEMIFSFIYEKLPMMSDYCSQRKVVLTGPFGFTALVRLVLQAYKNFQYEKGLQHILGLIEKFQGEYEKFGDSMTRLGNQIETTRKTFTEIDTTRSKQLSRVVDKITEYSRQENLPKPGADSKAAADSATLAGDAILEIGDK